MIGRASGPTTAWRLLADSLPTLDVAGARTYLSSLGTSLVFALFPRPAFRRTGFHVSGGRRVTYFAYLDEFGHFSPYISRTDPRYK